MNSPRVDGLSIGPPRVGVSQYWFSLWNNSSIVTGDAMIVNKKLCVRTNGLLHYLQGSVGAYDIQLEDHGSKTLHKFHDGFKSLHSDMEKNGDALFPLD